MLEQNNLPYWLALLRGPNLNWKTIVKILHCFPSLADFFNEKNVYPHLGLKSAAMQYLENPDWAGVEKDLRWQDQDSNHFILTLKDEKYPPLLRQISYPPIVLFVKGQVELLKNFQIAVVGTRNPSPSGKEIAYEMAIKLANAGLIITSGLAQGIDTAAHKGALEVYKTIAIIGTGMDQCYPRSNQLLLEKIGLQGAILSEFPIGMKPYPQNFPRRNRIISGLSLGTLIVEANLKSGSLITAEYALNQGREIFAIPGSIYNPKSQGCHYLIKQGAKLVETEEDILEELNMFRPKTSNNQAKNVNLEKKKLDDGHLKLLECIGYEPTKIDMLMARSQYTLPEVTSILVDLELEGFICSSVGGYMRVT